MNNPNIYGKQHKSSLWKYLLIWGGIIALILVVVFSFTGTSRVNESWTLADIEEYLTPRQTDENQQYEVWSLKDVEDFFAIDSYTSLDEEQKKAYYEQLKGVEMLEFEVDSNVTTFVMNYNEIVRQEASEETTTVKHHAEYVFSNGSSAVDQINRYIADANEFLTAYNAEFNPTALFTLTAATYDFQDVDFHFDSLSDAQKNAYFYKLSHITGIELRVGPYKTTFIMDYQVVGLRQKVTNHRATFVFVANDGGVTVGYINRYLAIANEFLRQYERNKDDIALVPNLVDTTARSFWTELLLQLLPILIVGILAFILIGRIANAQGGGKSAFDFGKSKARIEDASNIRFDDVAGCEDEKDEMKEIVDYLKYPRKYAKSGARIPKGVILKGPPGTGKTLLAKAVAGEASVPFYYISGSDFLEMYVGVGASRVRDMFKKARMTAPCIVFIDEIDAVARQRGTGLGGGHDEREQTLNQLLVEMDGFENNSGIIVLAATNRIDVLDPALLRPGRFDRQIDVNLPDLNGRVAILKVHSKNKTLASDVSLESVARRTPGFSGAELENVMNEAAILSVRNKRDKISSADVDEAIDRVMGGPAKKTKVISDRAKRMVAYHEAGHAVIGLKIALSETVQKITIIPRGDAGGYVLMTPKDESMLQTKGELLAKITSYLAGRASEEVFFDDVTTGAQSDIERATNIARLMVTELGMSSLGPIQYENNTQQVFLGRDYSSSRLSGDVANEIDKAVREIIEGCLETARNCIKENKDILILIAETLLKYETITAEEIDFLIEHGSLDEYKAQQAKNAMNQKPETTIQSVDTNKPLDNETASTEPEKKDD